MTSSASKPGSSNIGMLKASMHLADADDLPPQVVGHAARVALYVASFSCRNVFAGRVERDRRQRRLEVVEDAEERAGEAVHGRHHLAGAAHRELDRPRVPLPWNAKNDR